jgi:hypothetical protein
MAERPASSRRRARPFTRWFKSLHGGQVAMLWVGWAAITWGLLVIGAATMGRADVWAALMFIVVLGGGTLLMVMTWLWFGARRVA